MIYIRARWADEAQTMVIGWDAEGNSETVPANHTLFRQPDDGPIGFVNNGGVIEPYEPPPAPPPVQTCPTCNGTGVIQEDEE